MHGKGTKTFLKTKNKKGEKRLGAEFKKSRKKKKMESKWDWNRNKHFSEEEKQKKGEFIRKYYLLYEKYFLGFYKIV